MALFEQGQCSEWAVDVLVRAKHNRVLPDMPRRDRSPGARPDLGPAALRTHGCGYY
jgi:hypothetical protein